MRILVTGRDGQVARSLAERCPAGVELMFAARPELDLAEPASIEAVVAAAAPDLLISAAAYTAVDGAEDEPDLAMRVNGEAPGVLARAAAARGAPVIHLSTDYVFDGTLDRPYREDDATGPVGAYGVSKLAGEAAVAAAGGRHAILRTAWVYSPFGRNFVRTMLRLAGERDTLSVVADQLGCPTSALDLADGIFALVAHWRAGGSGQGVYHLTGSGETNWAAFARAVLAESAERGGPSAEVRDVTTADYPTRARRPANSRLDTSRFAADIGYRAPDWRGSTAAVVARLLEGNP